MLSFLIYIIIFLVFFGDFIASWHLIPQEATVLNEIIVYILFAYSIGRKYNRKYNFHLILWALFLVIVAVGSLISNGRSLPELVVSLRLILHYYILYLALINLGLSEKQWKKLIFAIFIFMIIQLPVQWVRFCLHGIIETTCGTYVGVHGEGGGGPTAIIPVMMLGYLCGYYKYYKRSINYILLIIGFVAYGILGAKGALLYIYPIVFVIFGYSVFVKDRHIGLFRISVLSIAVVTLALLTSIIILATQKRYIPPGYEQGEIIDPDYAWEHTLKYTVTGRGVQGNKVGARYGTTALLFQNIYHNGPVTFFFGYGPGAMSRSILPVEFKRDKSLAPILQNYGVTGIIMNVTEYGMLGLVPFMAFFAVFAKKTYKLLSIEINRYWKAFAYGTFGFVIYSFFIFCCYNWLPFRDDLITFLLWFAMAAIYCRLTEAGKIRDEISRETN